jgi:hypothetical protein
MVIIGTIATPITTATTRTTTGAPARTFQVTTTCRLSRLPPNRTNSNLLNSTIAVARAQKRFLGNTRRFCAALREALPANSLGLHRAGLLIICIFAGDRGEEWVDTDSKIYNAVRSEMSCPVLIELVIFCYA